jgi:hypothetical protein
MNPNPGRVFEVVLKEILPARLAVATNELYPLR